jgi:enoyl-CoA hydratase/carnithine racemase
VKGAEVFETLRTEVDGTLGRLTLARPERLNALSRQALAELAAAARWFDDRPEVRVVVVSGEGRAFSAGFDLGDFATVDQERSPREAADLGHDPAEAVTGMRALTVAAIQGWCVGGGLVLAASCDLRVASASARFSIPEVDLGIPLAWGGIPRLVRELGPAITKELVLTCRPFDAEEARALRFLNRVVPGEELAAAADELARSLAAKPAYALRATKLAVHAATEALVPTGFAWNDADVLQSALRDPESRETSRRYLEQKQR